LAELSYPIYIVIFLENLDKASSEDAENLIEKIKKEVFKKTNVNLELELEVVGKK